MALGRFVVVYLDEILIFSATWEEYKHHVHQVLELLRTHKLQVKECKYLFEKTSVQYLGFIIIKERVSLDPSQVQELAQWPAPVTAMNYKSSRATSTVFFRCGSDHPALQGVAFNTETLVERLLMPIYDLMSHLR